MASSRNAYAPAGSDNDAEMPSSPSDKEYEAAQTFQSAASCPLSLKAFTNPARGIAGFVRLFKWYFTVTVPSLWKMAVGVWIFFNAMIQLKAFYPDYYDIYLYIIVAGQMLVTAVYFCYAFFWGGFRAFWPDTTQEVTKPGMVRCFSGDYWEMYLVAIAAGIVVGLSYCWYVVLLGASPSVFVALHCTLSSDQSTAAGIVLIVLAVVSGFLWMPNQLDWIDNGGKEEGRVPGGLVNPNIGFMTLSILIVFLALAPEVGSWWYLQKGTNILLLQPILCLIILMFSAHVAVGASFWMGVAKLVMPDGSNSFDNMQICSASSWPSPHEHAKMSPDLLYTIIGSTMALMCLWNLLKIPAWFICPHIKDPFSALIFGCQRDPQIVCTTPRWWRIQHVLLGATCQALIALACFGYIPYDSLVLPLISLSLAFTTAPFSVNLFMQKGVIKPWYSAFALNFPIIFLTIYAAGSLLAESLLGNLTVAWRTFWFLVIAVNLAPLAEFPVVGQVLCCSSKSEDSKQESDASKKEEAPLSETGLVALLHSMTNPELPLTWETYMSAEGTWFLIMAGMSWLTTGVFNPDLLVHNPLRDRLGYNNVCVAWDAPPTVYVIAPFASMFVYFGGRHIFTSMHQTFAYHQELFGGRNWKLGFVVATQVCYIIGFASFVMILPLSPMVSAMGHTFVFFFYGTMRMIFVVGLFFQFREDISWLGWTYLFLYCATVFVGVPNVFIGFLRYDRALASGVENPEPMLPLGTTVGMCLDYGWFLLNAFNASFLPTCKYQVITHTTKIK